MRVKKAVLFFLIFSFTAVFAVVFELPNVAFFVAVCQCLLVLKKAKVSILSLFVLLVNYALLQQFIAYQGEEVYGLLNLGIVPIYYFELFSCVAVFNIMVYWIIQETDVLEKEVNVYRMNLNVGYTFSILLCAAAIIITILIFPSVPSLANFSTSNRFSGGFLSFSGWSCVPFFFLAVGLMNDKAKNLAFCSAVFVMIWYVFHGERIDALSLLLFILVKNYYEHPHDRRRIFALLGILIFAVFGFLVVGLLRKGATVDFATIVKKLIIQETACDVVYVFNCAVDLSRQGIYFGGSTFLSYLVNCVPLLEDPYNFAVSITEYYYTVGGGLLFAEPVANFGLWFAPVYSGLFLLVVCAFFIKNSKYTMLVYMELFLSSFRIVWYGLNYPMITILYFVPLIILGDKMFSQKYLVFSNGRRRDALWR